MKTNSPQLKKLRIYSTLLPFLSFTSCNGATPTTSPVVSPGTSQAEASMLEDRRKAALKTNVDVLITLIDKTSKLCLSSDTSSVKIKGIFNAMRAGLSTDASTEIQWQTLRGARDNLPRDVQLIENDKIRECAKHYIEPLFGIIINNFETANNNSEWPDWLDLRFNFKRTISLDPRIYSDKLRLDLPRIKHSTSRIIAPQDVPFYQQDIPYPQKDELVRGTIVPVKTGTSRLSREAPVITEICFKQPNKLPVPRQAYYEFFDCKEGDICRPARQSTAWLEACASSPAPSKSAGFLDYVFSTAYATQSTTQAPNAKSNTDPFWHVPSLQTLAKGNSTGVGYTIFTIETDAFQQQPVHAVEVDVKVNGVPVLEDGLSPKLRPVPTEPGEKYKYSFALQSLNFQGARHGCDRIDLSLTPQNDERKRVQTTLSYVALRDVAPRTQQLGMAHLTWSASYIVPAQEWRHYAIANSYSFLVTNNSSKQQAMRQVETDKMILDNLGLIYHDQKLIGVIRPPRTIKPNGSAAYGLALGLVQENGQVRFTFGETDARRLADFVVSQRNRNATLRNTISPNPFLFNANGGSRTAPGMCEDVN